MSSAQDYLFISGMCLIVFGFFLSKFAIGRHLSTILVLLGGSLLAFHFEYKIIGGLIALVSVFVLVSVFEKPIRKGTASTHQSYEGEENAMGSAKWASIFDPQMQNLLATDYASPREPIVSIVQEEPATRSDAKDWYLCAPKDGHLLTAAPTRSGKGRGQIITNLLCWRGPMVVLDVKGENWSATAAWRKQQAFKVIRLAPFAEETSTWNPLDQLIECKNTEPNSPERQEGARYLANLMIVPKGNAKDPYWDNASKTLLQGLMLHVATAQLSDGGEQEPHYLRERTMAEVRRLLTLSSADYKALTQQMMRSEENMVRETANTMEEMSSARAQYAGVKTMLMEHTTVWSYERVQKLTKSGQFRFADLRNEPGMTVYIDVPPENLEEFRPLLRVLVGSSIKELRSEFEDDLGSTQNQKVLFLLDEFPQLAYMQPLEDALLYIGGYSVQFWFFVQDLSQLKRYYPDSWEQFIANCSVKTFFSVADPDTAEFVSKMCGTYTARMNFSEHSSQDKETSSAGESRSPVLGIAEGRSSTTASESGFSVTQRTQFVPRPLLYPHEVMQLPFGTCLTFVRGSNPVQGKLLFWDKCSLRERANQSLISPQAGTSPNGDNVHRLGEKAPF